MRQASFVLPVARLLSTSLMLAMLCSARALAQAGEAANASAQTLGIHVGLRLGVLRLQAGLDFPGVTSSTVWGPFVAITFAQYQEAHAAEKVGIDLANDPEPPALHSWFFVGLRAAFK